MTPEKDNEGGPGLAGAEISRSCILLGVWRKKKFQAIEFPVKIAASCRDCPRKSMFAPIPVHVIPHSGTTPASLDFHHRHRETVERRGPAKPRSRDFRDCD